MAMVRDGPGEPCSALVLDARRKRNPQHLCTSKNEEDLRRIDDGPRLPPSQAPTGAFPFGTEAKRACGDPLFIFGCARHVEANSLVVDGELTRIDKGSGLDRKLECPPALPRRRIWRHRPRQPLVSTLVLSFDRPDQGRSTESDMVVGNPLSEYLRRTALALEWHCRQLGAGSLSPRSR